MTGQFDLHANFAYSVVNVAPSPALTGTTLTVQSGNGALFPSAPFNVVCWPANQNPTFANAEILRVTAVNGDQFTVTRAQEGTNAQSIQSGYQIANAPTNKWWTDIQGAAVADGAYTFLVAAANAPMYLRLKADYICTGANDDVQINAALTALPASPASGSPSYGGGGVVELSPGTFTLGNPIAITQSNVTLRGSGRGSTYVTIPGSFNNSIITLSGGTSIIWNNVVENLAIDGNTTNQTSGNGIKATNVVECQIRNTLMKNILNSCLETDVANSQDLYNIHVHHNMWGGNVGAFVKENGGETNVYSDNYFFGAVGYSGGAYAMLINGGATIINNQMGGGQNANLNAYIRCGNVNPVSIIGNNINNYSKQAIQILGGGHTVAFNKIYGTQLAANTYNAIEVWDSGNIIIGNNFGKSATNFVDNALQDIVEKNNAAVGTQNGNIIKGNNVVKGISTQNPYTTVEGNIGWPDQKPLVTQSANYTINTNGADETIIASGSGTVITLPTAVGILGAKFTIKRVDATNTISVHTTSSQTIDGNTTYSLSSNYKYITVESDGANWNIIANN